MTNYKDTITWKKILGDGCSNKEDCNFLKVEYEKFRSNAEILASEIGHTLPNYTVHDITHIDALWEMTDIFLPDDYPLSPIECFVLGGAFILHDLGMAIVAYPEGTRGIQMENIWKDTVANLSKQKGISYDLENSDSIDQDINIIAIEKTLRLLHAQKAKVLAKMSWKNSSGKEIYLIDDEKLRNAYGGIIGQIAQSHWLECDKLSKEFPIILGALSSFPKSWSVDPLKLACIVRIADAMHIDDRRAPSLLKSIRRMDRSSEIHWIFQEKLYQPRIENNRIMYTSKSDFNLQEVDAWWLCYDTLKMIDKELKSVDALLVKCERKTFDAFGIYGIDSLEQIQKMITVADWEPVDTCIRVNNVAKLVSTLGGMQLYGDNNQVPLRELIQNAADAIRARRYIDGETDDYGNIYLSWGKEEGIEYIQVEDNGVGMSQNTLVNVLLDFGQSFWGTDQMHNEFPGLEQKSFKATGKFGIGFFSVFMWGERVKVISNRYDQARDNTKVLEFVNGVNSRPILRKANTDEIIKNGGTCIRVELSKKRIEEIFNLGFRKITDANEQISKMCFSLDCNLYINNNGDKKLLVKANDWLSMNTNEFLLRLMGKKELEKLSKEYSGIYELLCNNIKILIEKDGEVVGRACLFAEDHIQKSKLYRGIVTIDGFETTELRGIVGVLKGNTERASRDIAIPIVSQEALDRWVKEQAQLLTLGKCSDEQQIEAASFGCTLSSKPTSLPIARWKDTYINYSRIVKIVKEQKYHKYLLVQDATVSILEKEKKKKINLADNVFVCDVGMPGILQTKGIYNIVRWPDYFWKNGQRFSCAVVEKQIVDAIAEAWNCSVESLLEFSQFSDDDTEYSAIIGSIDNESIEKRVNILNFVEKKV